MNKYTKGSIAAGAGLILLLGGAGTFMSWNDNEDVTGGPVTAGQLRVDAVGEATWTVNGETVSDITGFRIVPGDTVIYTVPMTVTAEGNNLTADLSLSPAAIAPVDEGDLADETLVSVLNESAVLELTTSTGLATPNGDGTYLIDAGATPLSETVQAQVTLAFPFDQDGVDDEAGDDPAMEGEVRLDGMSVTLTQNLNPAAGAEA